MHNRATRSKKAGGRFFVALVLTALAQSSFAAVNYTVANSVRRNSSSDESVGSSTTGKGTAFVTPRAKGTSLSMKRASHSPVAFGSAAKRAFGGVKMAATVSCEASAGEKERKDKPLTSPPLHNFRNSFSHSWVNQLSAEDPHNLERSLKRSSGGHPGRPVFNGHYVPVRPTPLRNPKMVITSDELMDELGFHRDERESDAFLKYFSGDVDGAFKGMEGGDEKGTQAKEIVTWATPYALSIMGRRYTNNCPYGDGTGYGDGCAISIAEIVVPHDLDSIGIDNEKLYPHDASRYELQLKGAGQTPFCRGADGRAVLRSSIREFLASEAMHHLGISTTRALSLIVSDSGDTSTRPWYSDAAQARELPSMDDPRLSRYSDDQKREILQQLAAQMKSDPDTLQQEKNAITTRVARSFSRIGHLDLFARRVEMLAMSEGGHPVKETRQYQELEDMMWHVCYREFYSEAYEPYFDNKDAKAAAMKLLENSLGGISDMVAAWIRVGFVQGNFNADNCLVAGRTMDYGPFGFVDVYHPLSAKWTGSGDHFGFMNQPNAGFANFAVLVESLLPIIDANGGDGEETRDEWLEKAKGVFSDAVGKAMRMKMGLDGGPAEVVKEADELWEGIEPLLRGSRGDWILFWRQLTYVAAEYKNESSDYKGMLKTLLGDKQTYPFYDKLSGKEEASLLAWIEKWHKSFSKCYSDGSPSAPSPEETMRLANPKYVLREYMLVDAYLKADSGKTPGSPLPVTSDYSGVHELYRLIKEPYSEGTEEQSKKFYRRAPDESLTAGGTAFMS